MNSDLQTWLTITALDAPWQILVLLGVILSVGEIFVSGFFLLPIGMGFFLTAILSLFTKNWVILLPVLACIQVGLFLIFQFLYKKTQGDTLLSTNAQGMIGLEAEVTEIISKDHPGYIKLYGDRWQAKTLVSDTLVAGEIVVITALDGNKVIVKKKEA